MNSESTHQTLAIADMYFESQCAVATYDLEVDEDASFVIGTEACVVVHNSAQIAIGSPDDKPFLDAKRWDAEEVSWRARWRAHAN